MSLLFDPFRPARAQTGVSPSSPLDTGAPASSDVRQRVELLALANQALFEILQEKLGLTEEDMIARMAEIDVRDGARDGRLTPKVVSCTKCRRKVSTSRQRCMYCGEWVMAGSPFEKSQPQ